MTAPVSVKLLDPRAKLPAYGSPDAAGRPWAESPAL